MKMTKVSNRIAMRPLALVLAGLCATARCAQATVLPPALDAPLFTPRIAVVAQTSSTPHTAAVLTATSCDDNGPGTLRELSGLAGDGDTIDLSQLPCSTISLTTGAITFGQTGITLKGPGREQLAIDASQSPAGPLGNVIADFGGGWLEIDDMTIRGGRKYASDQNVTGGCIYSNENMRLSRVTVTGCSAISGDTHSALGGGVFSVGRLDLYEAMIDHNYTKTLGAGYSSGGGAYTLGGIHARYCVIAYNVASHVDVTTTFGGGIFARGYAGIFESTIRRNIAIRAGGMALAATPGDVAFVMQSTITSNHAYGVVGGMYARQNLFLYNSTIANNAALYSDLNGAPHGVGLHWEAVANLAIVSSIISTNVSDSPQGVDLGGPLTPPAGLSFT
jgi:hypothetical protein